MATFPTGGKITFSGFKRQRVASVVRSDMESGPAKQALRASRGYIRFPVTYLFTAAEYTAFDTWVKNTINFVGVFDWVDPYTGTTHTDARIIEGNINDATPLNPHMADWVVKFQIEVLD